MSVYTYTYVHILSKSETRYESHNGFRIAFFNKRSFPKRKKREMSRIYCGTYSVSLDMWNNLETSMSINNAFRTLIKEVF